MPAICRDEIKEGYVRTFDVKHDELPPDTNRIVTDFFFKTVEHYLKGNISIVIEAAFQHHVWEPRIPTLIELSNVCIVLALIDQATAADRSIQRGLDNPDREFYHGDNRVVHFRNTGEILPPAEYAVPKFDVPTIEVTTDGEYDPSLDEIVRQIRGIA